MDNRRYRKRESSMHKSLRLIWQTSKGLVLVVLALVLGLILFFALTKKKAPSDRRCDAYRNRCASYEPDSGKSRH